MLRGLQPMALNHGVLKRVENPEELEKVLKMAVEHDGPTLVDVISQPLEESNAPVRRWMG